MKRFLTDQLFSSNPYETPASNHSTRHILLNEMAQAIEGKFADQPLVEEEIREALAKGLVGFGEIEKVIHQSERMSELRRRRFPPGHSALLEDLGYLAVLRRVDGALHLHGLEGEELVVALHFAPGLHE